MKKTAALLAAILCTLLLSACIVRIDDVPPEPPQPQETTPPPTTRETLPKQTTQPLHSAFYIPDLSAGDVLLYFNEVCLAAEYINSGDPSVLQKWEDPIQFIIYGTPTQEDRDTLNAFVMWLNYIDGFPGIWETTDPMEANLRIHFCSQDELLAIMGSDFQNVDGAVTFWYRDDVIYDAVICLRTDLDQHLRNSVILEELYNSLGPIQDTALRPDSIIYSEFSEPQKLTPVDELILRLLYHPRLQCGMTLPECETVIREIYY